MRRQYLLAFITGSLMPLGFAPFHAWPVVVLAPALLLHFVQNTGNARQAFWLGGLFGLGYFGFGVYWLYHSMHVFGHAPVVVAAGLTGLMIVTLSTFVALSMLAYRHLDQSFSGRWLIWLLPLLWFAMEWSKGWVLTGFPWLSLGYAHTDSPLAGFAPLVGVYGISALSLCLSVLLLQWRQSKNHLWSGPVLLILLTGYWLLGIDWSQPSGEPLTVTMVQGNIPQEMKWRRDERLNIIKRYWSASQKHWDSNLLVWPEVAIPGRSEDLQKDFLDPMTKAAREHGSNLLTGIVVSNWLKREYYNSMLLLGEHSGVYHKRHMVPFGEYMPFRSVLEFMKNYIKIPMSDMSAGPDEQPLMMVDDVKLGVSICYEDVFSRDINRDLPDANILVNTSNDAWFGDSLAPHQHLQIARMRSLETARPMVRSTNTGSSAFIDHKGMVLQATPQFEEATLTAALQGRSGSTPFLWFEGLQSWLAVLILATTLAYWLRARTGKRK